MARKKSPPDGPVYYTTYQVAKFLGVSLPTVVNWVNSGRLAAHRTPGGHRRIRHHDVVAFAREHNYPLDRSLLEPVTTGVGRVLVVDDERDFGELVRDYLVAKGSLSVEIAESGFQAGLLLGRFRPDLVLLDIMMPDMDGFHVQRVMRSDPETRHIPMIACTGYRDPDVERRIREANFDGYVEKPIKLEALLALVLEQLRVTGRA